MCSRFKQMWQIQSFKTARKWGEKWAANYRRGKVSFPFRPDLRNRQSHLTRSFLILQKQCRKPVERIAIVFDRTVSHQRGWNERKKNNNDKAEKGSQLIFFSGAPQPREQLTFWKDTPTPQKKPNTASNETAGTVTAFPFSLAPRWSGLRIINTLCRSFRSVKGKAVWKKREEFKSSRGRNRLTYGFPLQIVSKSICAQLVVQEPTVGYRNSLHGTLAFITIGKNSLCLIPYTSSHMCEKC